MSKELPTLFSDGRLNHWPIRQASCAAIRVSDSERETIRQGTAGQASSGTLFYALGLIVFLLGGMMASVASSAAIPTAVPVDGPTFRAALVEIGDDWRLVFDQGETRRTLPAADLVRWGTFAEPVEGPIAVLADGGLLVGDVLGTDVQGTDKERLRIDSLRLGAVALPLDRLAGLVFDLPAGRRQRDLLFDRLRHATGESDQLLLANGDVLRGTIEAIGDDAVRLTAGDEPLEIDRRTIAAVALNPLLRRPLDVKGPRAWVGLDDGSRLLATSVRRDDATLRLSTAGDVTCEAPARALVALQPLGGRVTYLSDVEAAGYRHVPYLSVEWPYRNDRNADGGRLRCDGRLVLKGLGMHSAARLTYALDGSFRRFEAELGIDDSTDGGGSVRCRIFIDGQQRYASDTVIRGGTPPVPISVDLLGGKRLDLVIDYADRADQLDRADWLDARLVR